MGRLLVTSGASVTYYRALSLADPNFAPGPVAAIKQAPAVLTGWLTGNARCPVLLRGVVIALLGLAAWAASPTRRSRHSGGRPDDVTGPNLLPAEADRRSSRAGSQSDSSE